MNTLDLSIVVTVFNSDKSLIELVSAIKSSCKDSPYVESYEIVFVDDGSSNTNTWPTLLSLKDKNPKHVRCVKLSRNFGRPSALLCGFSLVKGENVLMMDDDLEHDPKFIDDFMKLKDHDLVIAHFKNKTHGFIKRLNSDIKGYFDYKLTGKPKHIKNSAYKLIKIELIKNINQMTISQPFVSGLLFFLTDDIVNISIEHKKRKYGKSGYTFSKMIKQFLSLLYNNSTLLLKLVSYMGMIIAALSFAIGIFYIIRYFNNGVGVPGWTSLILITLFTSGTILLSLGVFGNYFIRLMHISENRPSYVIKERYD